MTQLAFLNQTYLPRKVLLDERPHVLLSKRLWIAFCSHEDKNLFQQIMGRCYGVPKTILILISFGIVCKTVKCILS